MSQSFRQNIRVYVAGGTIPAYRAVKFGADNKTVVVATAGDQAVGIGQNDAQVTVGQSIEVAMPGGGAKWTMGGSMTAPGPFACKSDGTGKAVKATDGSWVVGHIYGGGVDADIQEAYVHPGYTGAAQS